MKATGGDNSSSSRRCFSIEEMELRVGMVVAVSGEDKGAFYRVRDKGSGQGNVVNGQRQWGSNSRVIVPVLGRGTEGAVRLNGGEEEVAAWWLISLR
jgi:hypothetical protein